jgi:hypothetical protein
MGKGADEMRTLTRPIVAGALLTLGLLLVVSPAQGGIVLDSADVQPVGEPYFRLFYNLVIPAHTTVDPGNFIHIDSVPVIGKGGSNLVKLPPGFLGLNYFLNLFDSFSSPFFGSFIFRTNPSDTSLDIVYTGIYKGEFWTPIVTGATPLTVPIDTVGVRSVNFPDSVANTPGFQSELTAPLHFTSTTNGVTTSGTVTPVILAASPEPSAAVLLLSSVPVALYLAYRRARARKS